MSDKSAIAVTGFVAGGIVPANQPAISVKAIEPDPRRVRPTNQPTISISEFLSHDLPPSLRPCDQAPCG